MGCLTACLCTIHVPGYLRGQKRALDHRRLWLQRFVSCRVDAANGTWDFWKNSQCL